MIRLSTSRCAIYGPMITSQTGKWCYVVCRRVVIGRRVVIDRRVVMGRRLVMGRRVVMSRLVGDVLHNRSYASSVRITDGLTVSVFCVGH